MIVLGIIENELVILVIMIMMVSGVWEILLKYVIIVIMMKMFGLWGILGSLVSLFSCQIVVLMKVLIMIFGLNSLFDLLVLIDSDVVRILVIGKMMMIYNGMFSSVF